jgi:hypothetical protein
MAELLRLWGELQDRLVTTLEVLKAASVFDFTAGSGRSDSHAPDGKHAEASGTVEASAEQVEQRRQRKQRLKLLQKLECVDGSSYDAVTDALKEVSCAARRIAVRSSGFTWPLVKFLQGLRFLIMVYVTDVLRSVTRSGPAGRPAKRTPSSARWGAGTSLFPVPSRTPWCGPAAGAMGTLRLV